MLPPSFGLGAKMDDKEELPRKVTKIPHWWRTVSPSWQRYCTPVKHGDPASPWIVYSVNNRKQKAVVENIVDRTELPAHIQIKDMGFSPTEESGP